MIVSTKIEVPNIFINYPTNHIAEMCDMNVGYVSKIKNEKVGISLEKYLDMKAKLGI